MSVNRNVRFSCITDSRLELTAKSGSRLLHSNERFHQLVWGVEQIHRRELKYDAEVCVAGDTTVDFH